MCCSCLSTCLECCYVTHPLRHLTWPFCCCCCCVGDKLDERVNNWFIHYVKQLEQKLRAVQAHFVKMRLAEVQNNFQFAKQLLLAPGAAAGFEDEEEEEGHMDVDTGLV